MILSQRIGSIKKDDSQLHVSKFASKKKTAHVTMFACIPVNYFEMYSMEGGEIDMF